MATEKQLTDKQLMAIELLTCGKGMKYKDISEAVGVNPKTLWEWRNNPEYVIFQEELERVNNERWLAIVDVARESALALCKDGKSDMVKFVLQNAGYNPTHKVEADVSTDIVINIE